MNTNWQQFLAASGARLDQRTGGARVVDFGDAAGELLATRDATVVSPLVHLGLLGISGDDAKTFLHTQLTSDVDHLATESAQHCAWCTAKGRMLASFILCRDVAGYRALLSADLGEMICKRLKMFVLRSKVRIADLAATHASIGLSGPLAEGALRGAGLPLPATPLKTAAFTNGSVVRLDATRLIVVVDTVAAAELWTVLAHFARPVGTPAWQWLDIRAGVPLISDATKEEFVPQMADFDKIGGVSFHKGCYPGQEIVARTQYLGKVKRHLYRVRAGEAFAAGALILSRDNPEHPSGMVVNAAPAPGGGFVGLAVIQENFVAANDLELAGGRRVTIETAVF